jgi:glycosyltransferase involved in cell wall biosynthesis
MVARKRVLYATCYLDASGVTGINLNVLRACRDAGAEVHVLTTGVLPPESRSLASEFAAIAGSVYELRLGACRSEMEQIADVIENRQIDVMFICHSAWAYENLQFIKRIEPDLVIVDALHTLEPYRILGGFVELAGNRLVDRWVDKHVVISEQLREYLVRRFGVVGAKIMVIRNGVDREALSAHRARRNEYRRALGISGSQKIVGFVGRLVFQKNPELLLDCAAHMLKRRRDLGFVVVGGGPLLESLKREVVRVGIQEHFIWLGDSEEVYAAMATFDLLVVTSRYEGVPLVVLEALAVGVPVVSTDVGAIREQCGDYVRLVRKRFFLAQELAQQALLALEEPQAVSLSPEAFDIHAMRAAYLDVLGCNP